MGKQVMTLGRRHGSKDFEIIHQPSTPFQKQRESLKAMQRAGDTHPEFEEVQFHPHSSSDFKTITFKPPQAAPDSGKSKSHSTHPKSR